MRQIMSFILAAGLLPLSVVGVQSSERTVDPALVTRPAGTELFKADDDAALLAEGERLFDSLKLSENGLTCKSCHFRLEAYESSFREPYPHAVGMASKRAGLAQVHADEMVQLCLVVTMDSVPLDWASRELAALTAYVLAQQADYRATADERP